MTDVPKQVTTKNAGELLSMGIGVLIGSQIMTRVGSSGELVASVLAGLLIILGFVAKKKV